MQPPERAGVPDILWTVGTAFALVALAFALQGHLLINLADEGFLWYGAQHTALGEFPVRDFRSYDPGRYWWAAAWFKLWGPGLMSLRAATALFQALGLTAALWVLRRYVKNGLWLVAAGALLLLWEFPRHKLYDMAIAMFMVAWAARLVADPGVRNHFFSGVCVGLLACFGRNHGVYGLLSFTLLAGFIALKLDRTHLGKKLGLGLAGVVIGFSPMLVMYLTVPGTFQALLSDLDTMFAWGHSNTPLAVPWPWTVNWAQGVYLGTGAWITGLLFLTLPLYYAGFIVYLLLARREELATQPLRVAAIFIGAVYLHYAFSRADAGHLAHSMPPFLISLIVWPFLARASAWGKAGFFAVAFVLSLLAAGRFQPLQVRLTGVPYPVRTPVQIGGDRLVVDQGTADLISILQDLKAKVIKQDRVLIAPHWTAFYPILDKASPVTEIYFVSRETDTRQKRMVAQLESDPPPWVILGDVALDGKDELRFRNTHRLLWEYIQAYYRPVPAPGLPANFQLLKRDQDVILPH